MIRNSIRKGSLIGMKWDPPKSEKNSKSSESFFLKDSLESVKFKTEFPASEPNSLSLYPFFIKLIQGIKDSLGSIKNYIQISRVKLSDREFGEYYFRAVSDDIEKMEIVLNGLLDYMRLHTPIRKVNTVHNIVEAVLKKHRAKLEEKGIKLLKKFEKDLPQTVVPDEQLRFVLSSVLQYAMVVTPPNWNISLSAKSLLLEKQTSEAGGLFKGDGKKIEISVVFAVRPGSSEPTLGMATTPKKEAPDILLRFVKQVVAHNHGTMKIGTNEKRTKTLVSLRFPVERRRVTSYPSLN